MAKGAALAPASAVMPRLDRGIQDGAAREINHGRR
jgi:hypothetical protein